MFGGFADGRAFERNNALIALAADRLVEGDREEPLAEQGEERRVGPGRGQTFGIEPKIAAQFAATVIAYEQFDRSAAGLRLQRQLAFRAIGRASCRERVCQYV